MNRIEFIQMTNDELRELLEQIFDQRLKPILQQLSPKSNKDVLTRQEVASMFGVSISTIHNWCASGKLKKHGLGNRVYFLPNEVADSLTRIG